MKMQPVLIVCMAIGAVHLPRTFAQEAAPAPRGASQEQQENKKDERKPETDKADEKIPLKVVPEKEAIQQIKGSYRIVSGERSGEQILADRLADVTVRITEQTITTYDGERNQRFNATYRLDTQERPWRVKMTTVSITTTNSPARNSTDAAPQATGQPATGSDAPKPDTTEGLLEISEHRLKLIYALPGGEAPRRFKTAARQQMFVLEKLTDEPKKAQSSPATSEAKQSDSK